MIGCSVWLELFSVDRVEARRVALPIFGPSPADGATEVLPLAVIEASQKYVSTSSV